MAHIKMQYPRVIPFDYSLGTYKINKVTGKMYGYTNIEGYLFTNYWRNAKLTYHILNASQSYPATSNSIILGIKNNAGTLLRQYLCRENKDDYVDALEDFDSLFFGHWDNDNITDYRSMSHNLNNQIYIYWDCYGKYATSTTFTNVEATFK